MAWNIGKTIIVVTAALAAVNALHARPSDKKINSAQAERFCDQERELTQPWIQWAFDSKMACMQQTTEGQERNDCFHAVVAQLDSLQQEHAEIYRSQIQTVDPEHPVITTIMARLSTHRDFAITALHTDADPMQLASLRKQICLSQQ
jgi:hypothetical protein